MGRGKLDLKNGYTLPVKGAKGSRQNKISIQVGLFYAIICVMENPVAQMVRAKFVALKPLFDERTRRRWAATEARAIGRRRHRACRRSDGNVENDHQGRGNSTSRWKADGSGRRPEAAR